ncbi:S24 family peptidase [Mucilaginibacter sp. cycad4]|uniref:S24 family peptidase n=1 Tax=Mucilaginibacter sp. cycad4 TaxID=3342096 RepID=UPI002AAA7B8F|nr:S24 family peptidase [Mucilaginibacter gossypii]WPU98396.1 S24 family peptidase [Mucilaginibacter gossypii]
MIPNRPIDRFLTYLAYKNIAPFKAEKQLELGNGYIKKSQQRDGGIGSAILEKICRAYLDISLTWLITGDGAMLFDEQKGDSAAHRKEIPGTATGTGKRPGSFIQLQSGSTPVSPLQVITVDNDGNETILYVPLRASAGYPKGYADREYMDKLTSFSLPFLKNGTHRAFEVDGDSMFPTLENKEIVVGRFVEKFEDIVEDHVHIIVTKDRGILIKRLLNRIQKYGFIVAKSDALDNRNLYPNQEIYPEEVLEIWFAVGHINNKFRHPTDMYKRVNNLEADLTEIMRVLKSKNLLDK